MVQVQNKTKAQIIFDTETWTVEGDIEIEDNLLNELDNALVTLINCRELLARLRYGDY